MPKQSVQGVATLLNALAQTSMVSLRERQVTALEEGLSLRKREQEHEIARSKSLSPLMESKIRSENRRIEAEIEESTKLTRIRGQESHSRLLNAMSIVQQGSTATKKASLLYDQAVYQELVQVFGNIEVPEIEIMNALDDFGLQVAQAGAEGNQERVRLLMAQWRALRSLRSETIQDYIATEGRRSKPDVQRVEEAKGQERKLYQKSLQRGVPEQPKASEAPGQSPSLFDRFKD